MNSYNQVIDFRKKYKKFKKKRLLRTYYSFFIIAFISFAISWISTTHYFNVQKLELSGLTRDSEGIVKGILGKYKILNAHFFSINPIEIKKELQSYAIIEYVMIERWLFPPRLKFNIIERKPYLKIFYISPEFKDEEPKREEKYIYIDKEGVILPIKSNRKPICNILFADTLQDNYLMSKIVKFDKNKLEIMEKIINVYEPVENKEIFYIKNLNNIILERQNRIYWLGRIDEFEKKINIIPSLKELEEKYKDNIKYIDLRIWHAPVIKKIK